jgi:hypothetical protein
VDRPAVDRARRIQHGLAHRRVRVDYPLQLRRSALEGHHGDQLGDHVAGPVADDVGAEDFAVLGVDDELDDPVFVVVDGAGALAGDFCLPIFTSRPASLAAASVRPTLATCGWVKVAPTRSLVGRQQLTADEKRRRSVVDHPKIDWISDVQNRDQVDPFAAPADRLGDIEEPQVVRRQLLEEGERAGAPRWLPRVNSRGGRPSPCSSARARQHAP